MRSTKYPRESSNRKRGVVAIQVGVMMVTLLSFAALTVDVSTLFNVRGDLQRTADAAALAGVSAYVTDSMMRVRQGSGGTDPVLQVQGMVNDRVNSYAQMNATFGQAQTNVEQGDIGIGWINVLSGTEPIQTGVAPIDYNAVRVMVRRENATGEGSNGPVQLFFAPIFGRFVAESSASAVAVFDDRFSGFNANVPGADLLPFTIHEDAFYQELNSGGDTYSYNDASNAVNNSPDGIREVRIYPYPLSGSGYTEGDGNFGVLNIGTGNQGVSAEQQQILNGVAPSDFEMEIGTSDLTFFDDSGAPTTYDITGSPGMEASLKATVELKVGQVVGFFLHTNVILSGANAIYTITELRFGRVMDIKLTGAPNQRGLFIQPTSYVGGGVRIDPSAPSSNGLVGRLVLAR